MNRLLWALAILVDIIAIFSTWPFFTSEPTLMSVGIGVLLVILFGALLILLIRPKVFGHRVRGSAKFLCFAVPGIAFVGSLDSASISGHEMYAIVFAGLIGWLNWVAFRQSIATEVPSAA